MATSDGGEAAGFSAIDNIASVGSVHCICPFDFVNSLAGLTTYLMVKVVDVMYVRAPTAGLANDWHDVFAAERS